jgi:hypothetical protein
MAQLAQGNRPQRVPLGALVDRQQREAIFELAREDDCSVSRIVRRALAAELKRINSDPGGLSSRVNRPVPAAHARDLEAPGSRTRVQRAGQKGEA